MNEEMLYQEVSTIRRDLHRIPEIAFDLPKTSEYVRRKLVSYGYEPVSTAGTGWIAVLEGKAKQAVAFRADMDALEVMEMTGVPYASLNPGRMHACGHDGHMAMLLGFAKYLKSIETPGKTIVLIFQPAEEGPGGARVIMEEGILDALQVEKIYGFHLYPNLPEGIIGLCSGPFMARNGEFDIEVTGKSAHAGQPQLGSDAIISAAQIILSVQNILGRNLDPLEPAVINIGTLHSGEARNIVSGKAFLTGTIRAYDKDVYEKIKERLRETMRGIEIMSDVSIDLEIRDFYPEVRNDSEMVVEIQNLLNIEEYEILKPLMLAEDFSFYQEKIRGVFMFLGTRNEDLGFIHSLHHERFDFNEEVLVKGIEMYRRIIETL